MTLDIANTPEIVARVLNYEVDIGMIEGELQHRELELIPWRDDELVVFCAANHPLASKSSLSTRDIKSAAWILREPDSGARQTFDQRAWPACLPALNVLPGVKTQRGDQERGGIRAGHRLPLAASCSSETSPTGTWYRSSLPRRDMRRTFYFALPRKRFGLESVRFWMDTCRSVDA